ncbi:unnamed protein product, partial [Mesorhabditis spiculigera]
MRMKDTKARLVADEVSGHQYQYLHKAHPGAHMDAPRVLKYFGIQEVPKTPYKNKEAAASFTSFFSRDVAKEKKLRNSGVESPVLSSELWNLSNLSETAWYLGPFAKSFTLSTNV